MKAAHQQVIVDLLLNHTSLTAEALSEQLKVSKETTRRDLNELQTQGKILRNRGHAKYIHRQNQGSGNPFHIRLKSHYTHKADVAHEALAWIEGGMVIALNTSSACWYLVHQLPGINIQVFTNNHPICHKLDRRERIQLISSGGTLECKRDCYVNPPLISQLKLLEINLFIFSCERTDSNGALWDSNTINADYKSMLLRRVAQSLLLIDKSEFNRSGEARTGHLDEVTHIVSDERQVTISLVTAWREGQQVGDDAPVLPVIAYRGDHPPQPRCGGRAPSLLRDRDTTVAPESEHLCHVHQAVPKYTPDCVTLLRSVFSSAV